MTVRIKCTQCGAAFRVSEAMRGKRVQCQACSKIVMVSLLDEETVGEADVPVREVAPATYPNAKAVETTGRGGRQDCRHHTH